MTKLLVDVWKNAVSTVVEFLFDRTIKWNKDF
ncbi:hypothetical protein JZO67_004047 [Enterococcus sp. 665A]|uniref:Uncharacterized protein n=1 Tax=Candidatus Enterococcus ferrettii TaxID=2815324 RepID=A0ABV0ETU1_9ENTE